MIDKPNPDLELIQENLDARIKRIDEDRWLSSRYAPQFARKRLLVLYAFQLECVRATMMSEVMLRHIRIQWWRDAIDEIADGQVPRRHDLVLQIADLLADFPELTPDMNAYLDHFDAGADSAPGEHMMLSGGVLAVIAGRILSSSAPVYRDELHACGCGYEAARLGVEDAEGRVDAGRSAFNALPADLSPAAAHISTARDYLTSQKLSSLLRRWRIFRSIMTGSA